MFAKARIMAPGLLTIALLTGAMFTAPTAASAGEIAIGISLRVGPPPIPIYTQPICPGPGYMWTPGYWAFDPDAGYYWVPGTWVAAPEPGLYWTPGYWGWGGSVFVWHAGYWGPHVGFYGGVNYGFGYTGVGFAGGEWRGRDFYYNRSVANITNTHITNVYYRNVNNNFASNRVSYNGGEGGLRARPGREEISAEHERRINPTSVQREHESAAHHDRSQFAAVNHGTPQVAATRRAGELGGPGAVRPNRAVGSATPAGHPAGAGDRGGARNNEHPSGNPRSLNPTARGAGEPRQPATNYGHTAASPTVNPEAPRGTGPGHDGRSTPPFHYNPAGGPPADKGNSSRPSYARPSGGLPANNTVKPGAGYNRPSPAPPAHTETGPRGGRPMVMTPSNHNSNNSRGGNERPAGGPQNSPRAAPAQPHTPPPSGGQGQHGPHGGPEPDHRH